MARAKKDGRKVNYYIDSTLLDRFDKYCEEKGQTKTTALERILEEALDHYDKEKASKQGGMTREDYLKKNKAKLKREGFEFDEETGDLIYIEPIEYLEPNARSKRNKKTPTNFRETGVIEEYGFFGGGEQSDKE